jgi:hypothetical protein
MSHRRFEGELELGFDWRAILAFLRRNIWPLRFAMGGGSHSFWVFGLGFKAFETTSHSRLEDAFQEVCTEDSFTG